MQLSISFLIAILIHSILFLSFKNIINNPELEIGSSSNKTVITIKAKLKQAPKAKSEKKSQPEKEIKKIPVKKKIVKKEKVKPKKVIEKKPEKEIKKITSNTKGEKEKQSKSSSYSSTQIPRMASSADYLNNPPPKYPLLALRRNQEGTAVLRVEVNKEGYVKNLALKTSSGYSLLDTAALKSVKNWRFIPAKLSNGKNTDSVVIVPVEYRIR